MDDYESMYYASQAGVDYYEAGFGSLANFSDDKIKESYEKLREYSLECTMANGFLPGELNVVGENVDYDALLRYITVGFERAKLFGIKKVVFGSGRARSFPEGFSEEKAKEQLLFFLSEYASPLAKAADCIIVMEPLRFCESSMIHTVKDGVEIARLCGKDNVFGLADLYHVYGNNDSVQGIADFAGAVRHAHIAEPVKRRYPSLDDSQDIKAIYAEFIESLKKAGCDTCSVEAATDDFSKDVFGAVRLLKTII